MLFSNGNWCYLWQEKECNWKNYGSYTIFVKEGIFHVFNFFLVISAKDTCLHTNVFLEYKFSDATKHMTIIEDIR